MLKVSQYEYIRTAHRVYGKSIRQIAKETGHSRNTVKRALREEYCQYRERKQRNYPVLGDHLSTIDEWIRSDRDVPKKQRHTARRVYNRLKKERGYSGSESTVRRYVCEARVRAGLGKQEVFIPLSPKVGKECEIDWGSARAVIGGQKMRIKFFCMRSKYSGKHFVRCYPGERQEMFFDGHMRGFEFFGGVYPVVIYDNLTTAVRKVLQGHNRILQESYRKFQSYYNFTPRFCNVSQGHEKGGVEGLVGFARRNYMVPIPHAESLEALNEQILGECFSYGDHRISGRFRSVSEDFETEKDKLIPLPVRPYSNLLVSEGKVDKYSTVIVDRNRYSVPTKYAGTRVKVLLGVDKVEIFRSGRRISSHTRIYEQRQWSLHPDHYLELIQKRPQAFESARPIQQWRQTWPASLESLLENFCQKQGYSRGVKDFISVLMFYREHPPGDVHAAVELALETRGGSSSDVKHFLLQTKETGVHPPLQDWSSLPAPDLSVYDRIGGVS